MNLKELKEAIDCLYNNVKDPEKLSVVISLNEDSVGAGASTGIKDIYQGFDWEANQIRIEPSVPLVRDKKE